MKISRRGFVGSFAGTLGMGAAASLLSSTVLPARSANAQTRVEAISGDFDGGIMQLNQNESARGPGPKTMEALHSHISKRVGRGYSPDHVQELQQVIANYYSVATDNVLLGTGSTPILQGAVRAFCSTDKSLVAAAPTYATSANTAEEIGVEVAHILVDATGTIDLGGMAEAANGAGLVYLCNPNNPTGTVHGPEAVEQFVRQVMQDSPDTLIHIDEAYINYADPAKVQTALPLVHEFANVFITRSFSKAHGIAGLRVGYALGQPQTLAAIDAAWGMGDVNMLAAIAAITAMEDNEHIAWERQENAEIRAFTIAAFQEMGYEVPDSQTNHIFVNLGFPASQFRDACLEQKILVGRDFPPLANTHCRISIGSREEMGKAVEVFRRVLA